MTKHKLKWIGAWICALTLLVSAVWTMIPSKWLPQPKYCAPRWGFVVGRDYAMFYYVTVRLPPGETIADFGGEQRLAESNRWLCGSSVDLYVLLNPALFPSLRPTSYGTAIYSTHPGLQAIRRCVYVPLKSIPLLILILVGAATGVLWYLDRRRSKPGHCEHCGYNLSGNVSGRCPECGTAISRELSGNFP